MIDWQQAASHVAALGIGPEDPLLLALFPPKAKPGEPRPGCHYVPAEGGYQQEVERELSRRPGFSLGLIQNPGGSKDTQISYCRSLYFEDDGGGTLEDKEAQWEAAGLPRPSLQVWTGGKSVHHYWLLEEPCTPEQFRRAQKRLIRHAQAALPEADIDKGLHNPARILRMAGGVHPSTGEMSRILSAGGQKYSYEQLWNLTGNDSLPQASTLAAVRQFTAAPSRPAPVAAAPAARPGMPSVLPDYESEEHKLFRQLQVENDVAHPPQYASFRDISRGVLLQLVVDALPYCPDRGPAGSGTYPAAWKVLASAVNHLGANDAMECAARAGWGQSNWDIVREAHNVEENSTDRTGEYRVTIFHLFDTAEFNGWVRPWAITKSKGAQVEDPEEAEENRLFRRLRVSEWIEARGTQFTLADALAPELAALLGERAKAFPVHEVAMLPPFIATMASVLGTRYQVEVKGGWRQPMVFWLASVGPASSLKSPVANQMLWPLLEADRAEFAKYKEQLRQWKAESREERGDPPAPPRRHVAGDATFEAMCSLLAQDNTPGVVSFHDELMQFIGSMDKYRQRSSDRSHWLSMFDGGALNVLRKGSDPVFVPETAVSLFGCVQQDKLQEMLTAEDGAARSGDGFWARFLWCVPANPLPLLNWDESDINQELLQLMRALDYFSSVHSRVVVRLGDEARELFKAQVDQWTRETDKTYAARAAFLGKLRGYAARFAGLLHALDYAQRNLTAKGEPGALMDAIPTVIEAGVMERALILCRFFLAQFDVLAPQVGGNEDLPAWVVKVVELAQSREDRKVTNSDLRRRKWGESQRERKRMLESLVKEYGLGKLVEAPRMNQTWWQLT